MSGTQVTFPDVAQGAKDPDGMDVYSNQIRLGATLYDITVIFGATEDAASGQVIARDKVTVRLAPGAAKLLALHLAMVLEAYEECVAKVPMPARLSAELSKVKDVITGKYREQMQVAP